MEIKLERGYNSICFGSNINEVVQSIGEPDKKYNSDNGDIYYEYHELHICLKFEKNLSNRLGWVEIKNKKSKLLGVDIWNFKKCDLIKFLEKKLKLEHSFEDYGSLESISFDEVWLEIQYEMGKITSVNIGVMLDENDQAIWP